MSESSSLGGRRVVLTIYVVAVATAGLFGYMLGFTIDAEPGQVASFGPITFALTPLNLALYGMVVIGVTLAVGLTLVLAASQRVDALED